MHPGPADPPAGVLAWRYRLPAAAAPLPGGPRRMAFPPGQGIVGPAEPDRAGAGHGHPGAAGAEMIQMRLDDPLADRHPLPAGPAFPLSQPALLLSPVVRGSAAHP